MEKVVDFDDEPTVIEVREDDLSNQPPALPFPLARERLEGDEGDWIADLPEAARQVLLAAARPAQSWPRVPRVDGAVAEPLSLIPSLEPQRRA